jgi:sn-glycerol 3-phosphate transport system permease protein
MPRDGMVERRGARDAAAVGGLLLGLLVLGFPLWIAFVAASHDAARVNSVPPPIWPGELLFTNLARAWHRADLGGQLWNTTVMALGIAVGKVAVSITTAFAVVYFRFPFRGLVFALVFGAILLPVEIRIVPTYLVAADLWAPLRDLLLVLPWLPVPSQKLSMLNTHAGLILPLLASTTATFLFRQFFLTVPEELAEAARMDGAGPWRFFFTILLPLSVTNIAALLVVMFIFGWNQYLWPVLVTTDPGMQTLVMGLGKLGPSMDSTPLWNELMAGALVALAPPMLVILVLQRWFVRGLIDAGK